MDDDELQRFNRWKAIYQEIVDLFGAPVAEWDFHLARINRDIHAKNYDRLCSHVEYLARQRLVACDDLDQAILEFRANVYTIGGIDE